MTDKQIIIDGVRVDECCYFDYENDGYEDSCYMHQNECSAQNCYYKQLKRKEQECKNNKTAYQMELDIYNQECLNLLEELKAKEQECEELKIYIESNEQQVKEVETLVMDNDRLINELDQLKAENEELKGIRDGNFIHALEEQKRADKYFKTLTEIKEIAEKQCICGVDCIDMKQILQKISECEG